LAVAGAWQVELSVLTSDGTLGGLGRAGAMCKTGSQLSFGGGDWMGYRDTADDERGVIGLSSEFEWDGDRWLFRRGGRAAPVEVTREEMISSVSVYENLVLFLVALLLAGGVFGLVVMGTSYDPGGGNDDERASLLIIVGAIVALLATLSIVRRLVTRKFNGRKVVGPPRSRMELRRAHVERTSWLGLFALVGYFLVILVWQHLPPVKLIDWLWLAMTMLLVGNNGFNAVLKWRMRPKAPAPA
jgi:hypothetical protein